MKAGSAAGPAAQEITSMPVASGDPLLSLPASVAVALLTRDTPELRELSSAAQVEAISNVLGGRLEPADKTKIESAFHSWSKGRGDWLTAGLVWAGPTRAAVVRGAVADPGELSQGATAMLKLLSIRAIAEPLSNWVGDMKLSGLGSGSAGDGVIQTVHVVRRPPKVQLHRDRDKPTENDTFDIVWSIDKEVFFGAAGRDARGAYASLLKSDSGKTLGQDAYLQSILKRLGPTITFAMLIDTARLGASDAAGAENSTVLITYGKDPSQAGNQAWLELDMPSNVVSGYAATASAMLGWSH
jgi:hypothetical protein